MISGRTAVYGLLGRPVAHSRSPALHNHWLAHHGVDGVYVCFPVPGGREHGLGDAIRALGLAGCNVTVPLKEAIAPTLDRLDPSAARLGAVNTIVVEDGALIGHNTDGDGFVDGLRSTFGDVATGARVVVLGAGGAALAVGAGLAQAGAASITLLNRTVGRAELAALKLGAASPGVLVDAGPLDPDTFRRAVADADLVVQATSGPAAGLVAALDPSAVPTGAVWVDLDYWTDAPPLVGALAARGVRTGNGLPMLVHQAARAFRLFTGISPDVAALPPSFG